MRVQKRFYFFKRKLSPNGSLTIYNQINKQTINYLNYTMCINLSHNSNKIYSKTTLEWLCVYVCQCELFVIVWISASFLDKALWFPILSIRNAVAGWYKNRGGSHMSSTWRLVYLFTLVPWNFLSLHHPVSSQVKKV